MKSIVLLSVLLVVLSPAAFGRGGHGGGHSGGHSAGTGGGGQPGSGRGASGSNALGNKAMYQGPVSGNEPNSTPNLHRVSSAKNETREDGERGPGGGDVESSHDGNRVGRVGHEKHKHHKEHEHDGDRPGVPPSPSPPNPNTGSPPPNGSGPTPGTAVPIQSNGLIAPRLLGAGGLMGWPGGYTSRCPASSSDYMVEVRCPGKDKPIRCCKKDKLNECCKDD